MYDDAIAFSPDVISVLIGINDIWHRYSVSRVLTTDAQIETNYRAILERLKQETNAKIVVLAPYLLDAELSADLRADLTRLLPIVRKLAKEYADVYVPLDELFDEAMKAQPEPLYYSSDGVHPNDNGRKFIGELYAEAVKPLVK